VRRGGTLSLVGVYSGVVPMAPIGEIFDRQISIRVGQANVKRWVPELLPLLTDEDPLGVDDLATHEGPLEQAPEPGPSGVRPRTWPRGTGAVTNRHGVRLTCNGTAVRFGDVWGQTPDGSETGYAASDRASSSRLTARRSSAAASIWRTRSRVRPSSRPIASSDFGSRSPFRP